MTKHFSAAQGAAHLIHSLHELLIFRKRQDIATNLQRHSLLARLYINPVNY